MTLAANAENISNGSDSKNIAIMQLAVGVWMKKSERNKNIWRKKCTFPANNLPYFTRNETICIKSTPFRGAQHACKRQTNKHTNSHFFHFREKFSFEIEMLRKVGKIEKFGIYQKHWRQWKLFIAMRDTSTLLCIFEWLFIPRKSAYEIKRNENGGCFFNGLHVFVQATILRIAIIYSRGHFSVESISLSVSNR